MMDAKIKTEWLKALRGERNGPGGKPYQQCGGRLRKDEAFCCLGVLCDIVKRDTRGFGYWREETFFITGLNALNSSPSALPRAVSAHAGFKNQAANPNSRIPGFFSLAGMNDGGKTFAEIADVIEAQL